MTPRRTGRGWVRDCLIGLAITVALVAVLEAAARAYWYARAVVLADEFEVVRPGNNWAPRPRFRKGGIEINSLGFRGPEIAPAKPPEVFRIVAMGDSATFGYRLRRDGPYPARLQARLDARVDCGKRLEVINAGVEGYQARHVRDRLDWDVRPLKPDLLLLYVGWNDLWSDNPENPAKRLDPRSPFNRLLRVSYAAKAVTKVAFDLRSPVREVRARTREVYESFVPHIFIGDYERLLDLAQRLGVRSAVLTLPSILGSPHWREVAERVHYPHYTTSPELLTLLWHKYNAAIREIARRRGVSLIELADEVTRIPESERLFSDTVHLTVEGADAVAAAVERQVLRFGLLPCSAVSAEAVRAGRT